MIREPGGGSIIISSIGGIVVGVMSVGSYVIFIVVVISQIVRISRIIVNSIGASPLGASVLGIYIFLIFGVGGNFSLEIMQGKFNRFRMSCIIFSSIRAIRVIIVISIGGIRIGASVLGGCLFWCWGNFCNICCNLSMNMGYRSLWSQHLGRNRWGYWWRLHIIGCIQCVFIINFCGGGEVWGKFAISQ